MGNITQLIQWISLTKRLPSYDAESSIERNNYETLEALRNNISDENSLRYYNNFIKCICDTNLGGIPKVASTGSSNIFEAAFALRLSYVCQNLPVNIHSDDPVSVKLELLFEAVKAGEILDSKILRILADESPYTK